MDCSTLSNDIIPKRIVRYLQKLNTIYSPSPLPLHEPNFIPLAQLSVTSAHLLMFFKNLLDDTLLACASSEN